ncbi:MAG: hypothetical protein RIQ53_4017 [Pseudomonadota bacterium]|jgi:hypothetical protein
MTKTTPKYRNAATGETWTGRGLQPKWVRAALEAGATLADLEAGAAPKAPAHPPIDLAATLTRDDCGYGALPGLLVDASQQVHEGRLRAIEAQARDQGLIVDLSSLGDEVKAGRVPQSTMDAYLETDDLRDWTPAAPDERPGWILLAVLAAEPTIGDAYAVWARPAGPDPLIDEARELVAKHEAAIAAAIAEPTVEADTESCANAFLLGNLMDAALKHFKPLAVPWGQLKEAEQARIKKRLSEDMTAAVKAVITAIASNQRVTFRAEVAQVQFKGGSEIVAQMKLMNSPEAHALADAAGGYVTVVIEDSEELLAIPDSALQGEPDQRPLFDASVAGTSGDVDPEAS